MFSHMALSCKDQEKIENFYKRFFGFTRQRVHFEGTDKQIIFLKGDGMVFELFKAKEDSPLPIPQRAGHNFPGWRHICFSVDNIEDKLEEMKDEIVITLGPIELNDMAEGMRACWFLDPEGNVVEIVSGLDLMSDK